MDADDRIEEILGEWRARCDAGESADPRDVIRDHPEHAAALRACFEALGLITAALATAPSAPAASRLRPLPGGRYAGFQLAGEGGMGLVYRATDTDLGRDVAFKVVRPRVGTKPVPAPLGSLGPLGLAAPDPSTPESSGFQTLRSRFLREARITAALEHPGVVPVHEIGETPEGVPYYTMRFVRGDRTLAQAMAQTPAADRMRLLDAYLKVCDTIRYAHARGVIHRDLKPANVALGEYGEVVVIDWGLARQQNPAGGTGRDPATVGGPIGTPGYMSPEAALGRASEIDDRTDVYSLGAILFEILTGRLPFPRTNFAELLQDLTNLDPPDPSQLAPAVPVELATICRRALARLRSERFASVGELVGAIRSWQARSARDAEIASARHTASEAVALVRSLGAQAPAVQIASASHVCRKVLELVPDDAQAHALLAELLGIHEQSVARTVHAERRRTMRRVTMIGLAAGVVVAAAFAVTFDAERRRTAAERDLKAQALGMAEAESASRREALDRAEQLSLTFEARALVPANPGLSLLLAQEAWRRHADPRVSEVMADALDACREVRTLPAHEGGVTRAVYDPSGGRIATTGVDGAIRVWAADTGRAERTIPAHASLVAAVAFDAQGRRLVTAPADGAPRIFDVQTGGRLACLTGHEGAVGWAEFSPDGRLVATAGWDGTARLWSAADGAQVALLAGHRKRVRRASFSPDGARVATVSEDGDARVWDTAAGTLLLHLAGHGGRVFDVGWNPGGTRIVTASQDRTARIWDATTGAATVLAGHEGLVIGASFSPRGDRVLTASWDGCARSFEATDGALLLRIQTGRSGLHGAAWSPDGARIVTAGSWDHDARCWDAADGREVAAFLGHGGRLACACFSPDGRRVLTCSEDGTARIWDVARRSPFVRVAIGALRKRAAVQLSPDGRWFLTRQENAAVRLWDAVTGTEAAALAGTGDAGAAAFDGSSRRVVAGCPDGSIVVCEVPSGAPILCVRAHAAPVTAVEFTADGASVLSASEDGTVRLCDAATGGRLRSFGGWAGRIVAAHISPNARRVVASVEPDRWSVLDTASGAEVCGGSSAGGAWDEVVLSPDGLRVATEREGDESVLWDAATGHRVASLGRQVGICPPEFDGQGRRVATALSAGVVRISSSASGRELFTIPTDGSDVTCIRFSPDGRFLVTTTTGEGTRVHDSRTGDLLRETTVAEGWVLGASVSADGDRLLTWTNRGAVRIGPLDVAAAVSRTVPRELTAADRARFGLGENAPAAQRLDDALHALQKGLPEVAITISRSALAAASPDPGQRARLLYCVACALERRTTSPTAADVVEAIEQARRAGADPVRLADAGYPDVADPRSLDRLPSAARDAVLVAAYGGEGRPPEEIAAWALEARDAASRGLLDEAIGRLRRILAAGGGPRGEILVDLARLNCRRAAAAAGEDRERYLAIAAERLQAAAREPGGLPAGALEGAEFASFRDDPRFR